MTGLFKTCQRAQLIGAALDVGMAGLVVIDRRTVFLQHGIGLVEAG